MPDQTTSLDLLVISGSQVTDSGVGAKTTYEWNLTKQMSRASLNQPRSACGFAPNGSPWTPAV